MVPAARGLSVAGATGRRFRTGVFPFALTKEKRQHFAAFIFKENIRMKKFLALLLLSVSGYALLAQDRNADFKKYTQNTTGLPYGSNKAAGTFYDLRGFRMYAETYGEDNPC